MSQPQPGADRPADGAEMPSVTEPATAVDTEDATGASAPASSSGTPEAADDRTSAEQPSGAADGEPHDGTPQRRPSAVASDEQPHRAESGDQPSGDEAPASPPDVPVTPDPAAATPGTQSAPAPTDQSDQAEPARQHEQALPEDRPAPPEQSEPADPAGTASVDDTSPHPPASTTTVDAPDGDAGTSADAPTDSEAPTAEAGIDATPPVPVTRARGSAAVPGRTTPVPTPRTGRRPDPTRIDLVPQPPPATATPDPTTVENAPASTRAGNTPDPTRVENAPNATRVEAPRWSGSAVVPPPPPRRPVWGESAEPTPVPPLASPEHATPVDPWAGVDTTGWELHAPELPPPTPTLPYTAPWTTPGDPHPAHPAPPAAHPNPPAPPAPQPAPPAHAAPPAARPVSPYAGPTRPVSPPHNPPYPGPARPVSPPHHPGAPAARPVAPPPVAPPAKPGRSPKQRRGKAGPPAAPPPGWQQPPKRTRRRRRWPWLLLLSVACCCGVPLWWIQPVSSQYPASATLPDRIDSMRLRQDQSSRATAEELKSQVRESNLLAEDTFAGIYTTNDGKRVTLFGSTGLRFSPESDAKSEIDRLAGDYALKESVAVDTGVRGRYERCAVGRADGDSVVVCVSADHGSLTTGVFTRLSVDDSGRLLDDLRQRVVVPKS
ncbi:hypothetical protein [Micromonospora marina]|uniref:hypothetical protein n=1 Tax=Micromonospora marina TaxID=307120 RepID=UPI003D70B34D